MRVAANVHIVASPQDVFAFVTTPDHDSLWQEAAISTVLTTPGPVMLGSEMAHVGKWLGMRVPTRAIVTVFEPDRLYGYDFTSRLGSSQMRYELEPVAGGTRLTLSTEAPLPSAMRPLAPLLRRNVLGMFRRDVQRLKAEIERNLAVGAVQNSRSARQR